MNDNTVLYGVEPYGVLAALILTAAGKTPCCFCDGKRPFSIEPITGLSIISPSTLKSDYTDSPIIITAIIQQDINEIYAEMDALGIDINRVTQFYSISDIFPKTDELVYFSMQSGELDLSLRAFICILKNDFEIVGDMVRLKDLLLPFKKKSKSLFATYRVSLLPYLSGLPYTRSVIGIMDSLGSRTHNYILDDVDTPMTIKPGDIVIDAGASYGDFSLLAAKVFKAKTYSFEPNEDIYQKLMEVVARNDVGDMIQTIKAGLGSRSEQFHFNNFGMGSKISNSGEDLITVWTVDDFVAENRISRVDFIKADIEGHEREMLRGATKTLREYAPKLSLCTYHFTDDPVVLRHIISAANPAYKFEQRRNALFAWVDN
jgi:FkbM family methyltransferase